MTPHIEALKEEVAKTVIMPGDPLRAKYIAEKYLTDVKLINDIRNMFGYTGLYNGKKVTIMGSGMGMPSIGIYSYELYKFYDVENIIRVGTCGSYVEGLPLYSIVLVDGSYSDSSYAKVQNDVETNIIYSNKELTNKIKKIADIKNIEITTGLIYSSDVFYKEKENYEELVKKYNCLGVEMESFALFHNANVLNKKAACVLTVSDNFITKEKTTPEERQSSFDGMIELVLDSI